MKYLLWTPKMDGGKGEDYVLSSISLKTSGEVGIYYFLEQPIPFGVSYLKEFSVESKSAFATSFLIVAKLSMVRQDMSNPSSTWQL